jgi:8-oxo-dGTP pyrophosphatase MutT (NUDIX family)
MRQVISTERNVEWLPLPNEFSNVLSSHLPPLALITTALALVFDHRCLLMTHLRHRGWDIPGGHIELGETPEQAVHREVLEETGATLNKVNLLGYQHIHLLGKKTTNSRYPYPDSYQVIYLARLGSLGAFQNTKEVSDRALFTPSEARSQRWIKQNRLLYEAALEIIAAEGYV